MGSLAPLAGNLQSVYSLYNTQDIDSGSEEASSISRDLANPKFTNYCPDFKGTLDHILYNKNTLEVVEFLEMPAEEMIK